MNWFKKIFTNTEEEDTSTTTGLGSKKTVQKNDTNDVYAFTKRIIDSELAKSVRAEGSSLAPKKSMIPSIKTELAPKKSIKPTSAIYSPLSFVRETGSYNFNFEEDSKFKNAVLNRLAYLEGIATKAYKEKGGGWSLGIGDHDPSYTKDSVTTVDEAIKKFRDVDFDKYLQKTKELFPQFDNLSENLQVELYQGVYRGDFRKDHKTVGYINSGLFKEAASEFLRNNNYIEASMPKNKKLLSGVKTRMEDVRDALLEQAG